MVTLISDVNEIDVSQLLTILVKARGKIYEKAEITIQDLLKFLSILQVCQNLRFPPVLKVGKYPEDYKILCKYLLYVATNLPLNIPVARKTLVQNNTETNYKYVIFLMMKKFAFIIFEYLFKHPYL